MADNTVTCSHCQTENPPGQDTCAGCGRPLTASADQALREQIAAEDTPGLIGGGGTVTGGTLGVPGSGGIASPNLPGAGAGGPTQRPGDR